MVFPALGGPGGTGWTLSFNLTIPKFCNYVFKLCRLDA